jgi:F-type H+-transporting ATPase subunit epsilon
MATDRLHLQLVTPVEQLFDQPVDQVIVPTRSGQITVLPHHASLVSILEPGELLVQDGEQEFPLAVAGGTIEISENRLVVLADAAERAHEIDVTAAEQRAAELAKELENQAQMSIEQYNSLLRQLELERAKLSVGNKWRK